jgi:flagellar biogenesis protein FliO
LVTIAGSLALVLGIFFLIAWALRWASPRSMRTVPSEVLETLGRVRLDGRQQAHLLRLGNKLLLVSVSAAGAETLTEITDLLEVNRLVGLCRQRRSGLPPDVSAREGES